MKDRLGISQRQCLYLWYKEFRQDVDGRPPNDTRGPFFELIYFHPDFLKYEAVTNID